MRETRRLLESDEGMTLVEVLIAALIMFVILSGILVLVTTSTLMGAQATQKNLLTNAVNSYTEWVAALPFKQVDLVGTGEGILVPKTVTENGYTIVITPTVAAVSGNSSLKNLTLSLVMTDGAGNTHSYSTMVVIRDRSQFLTQAKKDSGLAPDVSFGSLTPPDQAVVWGSQAQGGVPLYLDLVATATEGRLISGVAVTFDGVPCENANTLPQFASWTLDPALDTWSSGMQFIWNTQQQTVIVDESGNPTGATVDAVGDGWRTLKAFATDDGGLEDTERRFFLVDNYPPAVVDGTSVTVAPVAARSATVNWKSVMDGGEGADSYLLEWVRQAIGHTASTAPFGYWTATGTYTRADCEDYAGGTVLSQALTLEPFSRYAVRIRAQSPSVVRVVGQPAESLNSDWAQKTLITRPLLSGTYTITRPTSKKFVTTSTLSASAASFATASTPTYTWYRSLDGGASYAVLSGKTAATITDSYEEAVSNTGKYGAALSYKCVITYSAAGYQPTSGSLETNRITTTPTAALGVSQTYPEGVW